MGIFDKLKQAGNYLSGKGAKVHIRIDDSRIASENMVSVIIYCQVKEHDLLVDELYVKIKAEEVVVQRNQNYNSSGNRRHQAGTSNRNLISRTYADQKQIDANFRLDAEGEYEWEAEFRIPSDVPRTYRGINARHEWSILAGLSKKGNDPDSGWIPFRV